MFVELGEDVGSGARIDSAERSLAGMVASLCIAVNVQGQPITRQLLQEENNTKKLVG
jgi:hypothetical protein